MKGSGFTFLGLIFALLLSSEAIYQTQNRLDVYRTPEKALEEMVYLPDGKVLKWASLGYTNVLADYLWIKSVLYFGRHTADDDNPFFDIIKKKYKLSENPTEETPKTAPSADSSFDLRHDPRLHAIFYDFRSRGLAPFIYPLLERVVILDPHFVEPYIFGGLYVLMDTGQINEAFHLLEFGYQHNPDRWELPYYLAFLHLFYRGDATTALNYLKDAVVRPDAPPFVQSLSLALSRRLNKTTVVVDYLKGIYSSTSDPDVRNRILSVLQKINADRRPAIVAR